MPFIIIIFCKFLNNFVASFFWLLFYFWIICYAQFDCFNIFTFCFIWYYTAKHGSQSKFCSHTSFALYIENDVSFQDKNLQCLYATFSVKWVNIFYLKTYVSYFINYFKAVLPSSMCECVSACVECVSLWIKNLKQLNTEN